MENNTITQPHIYTGEEITLILGGIGAMVASFVYALKNVKHLKSGCCECDQAITHEVEVESEPEDPELRIISSV
tara:strand:- start:1594 stop:1815 length:222 start_codon:yes stop_codon:yes gene_type:complete